MSDVISQESFDELALYFNGGGHLLAPDARRSADTHLLRLPTDPELPVGHEVALSVGFVRECVLYSSAHRDEFTTDTPLHDAADVVKNFWRRNSDS